MKHVVNFVLLVVIFIAGCATKVNSSPLIHSAEVTTNELKIEVTSTGCTREDAFILHWQQQKVSIERVKPDNCRRMPFKKWLSFPLPEGISSVKIENSFAIKN